MRLSPSITASVLAAFAFAAAPARAQLAVPRGVVGTGGTSSSGGGYTVTGTVGEPGAGGASGGAFEARIGFWAGVGGAGALALTLDLRILLEGPYDAGTSLMRTNLVALADFPAGQPYAAPAFDGTPLDYDGVEAATAPATAVDWVLVRLRTGTGPGTVVGTRAALLLRDGRVVDVDGASPVGFPGVAPGAYYVVVGHRNHLAVMSAGAVTFPSGVGAYTFTTAEAQAYGTGAMRALTGGVFALFGGDGNGSGDVSAADRNAVWRPQNGLAGYRSGDFNLSGDVSAVDRNAFWRPNNGRASQVPPN